MNIAILGATGNIGRLLTRMFTDRGDTVKAMGRDSALDVHDVIVNCVGNAFMGRDIFQVTEEVDSRIFYYLDKRPETIAVYFSSGVAPQFNPYNIQERDFYSLAKCYSEVKHRIRPDRRIVDIRLFNTFDRSFKRDKPFFINKVIADLLSGSVHKDNHKDMRRDYLSGTDLFNLVDKCIRWGRNGVFEAYSNDTITKFEILNIFRDKFGLKYELSDFEHKKYTGADSQYVPMDRAAQLIGYEPTMTSMENLLAEAEALLNDSRKLSVASPA